MSGIVELRLANFLLVYLLFIIVSVVMKICHVDKIKLLIMAGLRMSIQLIIAGYILTYIFQNPHPVLTMAYLICMTGFALKRALSNCKNMNPSFKKAVALSMCLSGLAVIIFFICAIVGVSFFNPQYVIPIAGMIMGNTMIGVSLATKTFSEALNENRARITALLNSGAAPDKILLPFMSSALETALLPTINSMLGMGIVSLPGMMTGQILSGTLPATAVLYQIAMMISVCTAVCLASFAALRFGMKTLYNSRNQIILPN